MLHSQPRTGRSRTLGASAAVLSLSLMVVAAPAHAADPTADINGVTYERVSAGDPSQGAVAVAYDSADNPTHPDLVIESTVEIDGDLSPVVDIGDSAFSTAGLTSVDLPETLTRISSQAFYGNQLTELGIPRLVTYIGSYAFRNNDLEHVILPASLLELRGYAFDLNPDLTTLRFLGPEPITYNDPINFTGNADPDIEFMWRDGPHSGDGFTWPTWHGYNTTPIAEVTFIDLEEGAPMPNLRLVALDQDGGDAPWGTISVAGAPAEPTLDGYFFGGWLNTADWQPWNYGDEISGDLELEVEWIAESERYDVEFSTSPDAPRVGQEVTLSAEGFNFGGESLGDVTHEMFLQVDDGDLVRSDTMVFSSAGTHEVFIIDQVYERAYMVEVEVLAQQGPENPEPPNVEEPGVTAPTEPPPADSGATSTTADGIDQLAETGPASGALLPIAAGVALLVGALLLGLARRVRA